MPSNTAGDQGAGPRCFCCSPATTRAPSSPGSAPDFWPRNEQAESTPETTIRRSRRRTQRKERSRVCRTGRVGGPSTTWVGTQSAAPCGAGSFNVSAWTAIVNAASKTGPAQIHWRSAGRSTIGRKRCPTPPPLVATSGFCSLGKGERDGRVHGTCGRVSHVGLAASHLPSTAAVANACCHLFDYRPSSRRTNADQSPCDDGR